MGGGGMPQKRQGVGHLADLRGLGLGKEEGVVDISMHTM